MCNSYLGRQRQILPSFLPHIHPPAVKLAGPWETNNIPHPKMYLCSLFAFSFFALFLYPSSLYESPIRRRNVPKNFYRSRHRTYHAHQHQRNFQSNIVLYQRSHRIIPKPSIALEKRCLNDFRSHSRPTTNQVILPTSAHQDLP